MGDDPARNPPLAPPPSEMAGFAQLALFSVINSPLTVVRTLIQLGYEPIQEQLSTNMFGQQGFRRASFVTFCKILYRQSGVSGLFLGWQPRVAEVIVEKLTRDTTGKLLWPVLGPSEEELRNESLSTKIILHEIALDTLCGATAVLVSQPFFVISTRMIAEHVGHEGIYTGLLSSIAHIYSREGLPGFFSGLVPALLQEVAYVTSITLFGHLIKHSVKVFAENASDDAKKLVNFVSHSVALTISNPFFFPFKTVRAIMAVNNSGLAAGRYPYVPIFPSWVDCFSYLYELNGFGNRGLVRGSNIMRRFYAKPLPVLAVPKLQ